MRPICVHLSLLHSIFPIFPLIAHRSWMTLRWLCCTGSKISHMGLFYGACALQRDHNWRRSDTYPPGIPNQPSWSAAGMYQSSASLSWGTASIFPKIHSVFTVKDKATIPQLLISLLSFILVALCLNICRRSASWTRPLCDCLNCSESSCILSLGWIDCLYFWIRISPKVEHG